jgi:murein DD-endopeptidase MepM/ murein hydrolase activator NlpD
LTGANIDKKIESAQLKIDSAKSQERKINNRLEKIAKEIEEQKRDILKINDDIKACKIDIERLKKKSKIKSSELKKIEDIYKKLTKREREVSKKVISIISKEISIEMISDGAYDKEGKPQLKNYELSIDNVVNNEILRIYIKLLRDNFKKTKKSYISINKSRDMIKKELAKLSNRVEMLKEKKRKLDELKSSQKKALIELKKKKESYVERLNRIKEEQNSLAKTLKKLHITKESKEREKQRKKIIKVTKEGTINVRKIGSSYQHDKIAKYTGPKTISPLRSYSVIQKFGNYIDPIYKIKIFNDAVILRSKTKNAKVRNVLKGTVIYADKTPMLDYVVIVKNPNNIHTIYAHLSQIAPTIRVGKKLKKGYIIGRVKRDLTFEVTQNEKHINPLSLIK